MDPNEQGITQGTRYLQPFDADVPLLHTDDGDFIPVIALCELFGLPASPYTALACQRFRPENAARRLPYRQADSTIREVWCIALEQAPLWFMGLRSERVCAERRDQLRAFKQQAFAATSRVYTDMQRQYRVTRTELFDWLRLCESLPGRLQRIAERAARRLSPNCRAELDTLMTRGYTLFDETATLARSMVQEIAQQPVVDTLVVNAEGEVVDTQAMPLLPMLSGQPMLHESQTRITTWFYEFDAFLTAHGLL